MRARHLALDALLGADTRPFVEEWLAEYLAGGGLSRRGQVDETREAHALIDALREGLRSDADPARLEAAPWGALRTQLADLSSSRAALGATAGDTSRFVLALKKPVFARLQARLGDDPAALGESLWWASLLVDRMAQFTADTHQKAREEIIQRQQRDLLELSTPVVKLWEGVLAVPMIGTLDSSRTQMVMETLLQRIVETGAELAIIDITGVPTVDTLVAQHLLKTVTAIRLMGADCIVSGIRPQIAQTIVHLGIDLQGITTKATLADALAQALRISGYTVSRARA